MVWVVPSEKVRRFSFKALMVWALVTCTGAPVLGWKTMVPTRTSEAR